MIVSFCIYEVPCKEFIKKENGIRIKEQLAFRKNKNTSHCLEVAVICNAVIPTEQFGKLYETKDVDSKNETSRVL